MANVRIDQLTSGTTVGWLGGPGFTRIDANTAEFNGTGGINFTRINLAEKAAAGTPVAGFGEIWVKSGSPNTLWFTDEDDTDFQIGVHAIGDVTKDGTPVNDQLGVWTGDGTIKGDANLTWDGTKLEATSILSNILYNSSGDLTISPAGNLSLGGNLIVSAVWGGTKIEGTAIASTGEPNGTKFLREDGDGTCSWQVVGGGDVTKDGTPVNDQLGVWTGDGTIKGDPDLTWNGSMLKVNSLTTTPYSSSNDFVVTNNSGIAGMSIIAAGTSTSWLTFGYAATPRGADIIWANPTLTLGTRVAGGSFVFQTGITDPTMTVNTTGLVMDAGKTISVDTITTASGDLTLSPAAGFVVNDDGGGAAIDVDGGADGGDLVITLGDIDDLGSSTRLILDDLNQRVTIEDGAALRVPQINTASGDLTLAPAGDVVSDSSIITPEIIAPKSVCMVSHASDDAVVVADGTVPFTVPADLNGYALTAATSSVHTKGVTDTTDVMIRKRSGGADVDMLSAAITIGDEWHASDGTIQLDGKEDVATGDQIFIDVDDVHTIPPNGLSTVLTFTKP